MRYRSTCNRDSTPHFLWGREDIPSSPLTDLLRSRTLGYCAPSIKELGRRYATRFGGNEASARRQLERLVNGERKWIELYTADKVCALLGVNLLNVYPDLGIDASVSSEKGSSTHA